MFVLFFNMVKLCRFLFITCFLISYYDSKGESFNIFSKHYGHLESKFGRLPEKERIRLKDVAKEMFNFGYDNYLKYAYPLDELDPIHCRGRGPDYDNP